MMPRVDVAIPTHGESRWLAEAIASVLGQTFGDLALTVSENGPGDGAAGSIVRTFADDRRVRHVTTGGVPLEDNWNRCFATGDGDYVAVLPHDERWDPDWLRVRVEFLEAHPACGFVFSSVREMDEGGRVTGLPRHPLREGVVTPEEAMPVFFARNPVPCCAVLARRSAVEELGTPMVAELRMGMDWMMWTRIAAAHPTGYLELRDNAGRIHAGSQTARSAAWSEMHLLWMRRFDELLAAQLPGYDVPRALRAKRLAEAHLLGALEAFEDDDGARARAHLQLARRAAPRVGLATVRGAAAHAALISGPSGRRGLRRARAFEARRQVRGRASRTLAGICPWLGPWLPL
jgi:glycosyltransferase involved in cell wall biosynthesis